MSRTRTFYELKRWARDRCEHCGLRFHWNRDARHSFGNRDGKVYHGPCIAYLTWRTKADERLAVLDLVCEVWEVEERTAKGVVENRANGHDDRVTASNRAFRVFYDLQKHRAAQTENLREAEEAK